MEEVPEPEVTGPVRLRLTTYFCAPNLAYLMVADAHDAVLALADMSTVDVQLEDHFAAAEINARSRRPDGFHRLPSRARRSRSWTSCA